MEAEYRTAIRRVGGEGGSRVLVRQPIAGGPIEVSVGNEWRQLKEGETLFPAKPATPQVNDDWVR